MLPEGLVHTPQVKTLIPQPNLQKELTLNAIIQARVGENFRIKTIGGYDRSLPKVDGKSLLEIIRMKALTRKPLRIIDVGSGSDLQVPLSLEQHPSLLPKAELGWWPINPTFTTKDKRKNPRMSIHPVRGIVGAESVEAMVSEDGTPLPIGAADIVIANNSLYQLPSKMEGVEQLISYADPHDSVILISSMNIGTPVQVLYRGKQLSQHDWWKLLQNYIREHGYTTHIKYGHLSGGLVIAQNGSNPLLHLPLEYAADFQIGKMERYKVSFSV